MTINRAEKEFILGKEPATAGYWFKEKKFKRLLARELIKILKDRALTGFESLEF